MGLWELQEAVCVLYSLPLLAVLFAVVTGCCGAALAAAPELLLLAELHHAIGYLYWHRAIMLGMCVEAPVLFAS